MSRQFNFAYVDDVTLAAENGIDLTPHQQITVEESELGAFVEYEYYRRANSSVVPNLLAGMPGLPECLLLAFTTTVYHPTYSANRRIGFIRTGTRKDENVQLALNSFYVTAQRAAEASGISKTMAQALVGAIIELQDNIHEHSQRAGSGLIGYRSVIDGVFEFTVADAGIGVLRSLQKATRYRGLSDAGEALQIALSDGGTRFRDNINHGNGFRPLFQALTNQYGHLRFRSGDHVLVMSGQSPSLGHAYISQLSTVSGFVISVSCSVPSALLRSA